MKNLIKEYTNICFGKTNWNSIYDTF